MVEMTVKMSKFERLLRENNLEQKKIHDYMKENRDKLFSWIEDPYNRSAVSRTVLVDIKKGRGKQFSVLTMKKILHTINVMKGKEYTMNDIVD